MTVRLAPWLIALLWGAAAGAAVWLTWNSDRLRALVIASETIGTWIFTVLYLAEPARR